ncbi:MAG: glycosyltransferase family 2 protein [Pseudomonadota bacterium]
MSWGTVTLADEPLELLVAFAAWHRKVGAAEIHIYLDRPIQPAAEVLAAMPGVVVTPCDAAFWAAQGDRPFLQTRRQEIVANLAYRASAVDWLAHIDADEFIMPEPGFAAELAAIPEVIAGTTLPVMERVWEAEQPPKTLFDGYFRVPIPGRHALNRHFNGKAARFLFQGFASHTAGKTLVRTGREIGMGIHKPVDHKSLSLMKTQCARLLHFDGLTPFHWLIKRLKYAALPHAEKRMDGKNTRWAQMEELSNCASLAEAEAFQGLLTTLPEDDITRLTALRLLEAVPDFSPAAALQEIAPGAEVDFSVAQFDAQIAHRDRAFLDALSLAPQSEAEPRER